MKNKLLGSWTMATAMLLSVLCFFVGCQTTVPVTYTEPARLNLSGVNKIAIDSDNPQVTTSISQKLTATGKYTVATEAELALAKLAMRQALAKTEISAADLAGAYSVNAVSADTSYKGKLLRITGVVNEIEVSSSGRYYVRLVGAGNDTVFVYFEASETSKIAAVTKGQTTTIIGECFGRNLPDMADTAEILRILGAGRTVNILNATFPVETTVDAIIFLKTASPVQDSTSTVKEAAKDADGNTITDSEGKVVYRDVTVYERSVTVNINYEIVRTRDSSNIGRGTKSATSGKSSNQDRSRLPAPADLVARTIDKPLAEFISEIVPTERSISVTLAKESENKDAKKEMSAAEKLVKEKNYRDAVAAYGKIYAQYKNFAAGYNQAVLTETTAGTAAAIVLMEALAKETDNSLAQTTLAEMQRRNASNEQAAAQL